MLQNLPIIDTSASIIWQNFHSNLRLKFNIIYFFVLAIGQ